MKFFLLVWANLRRNKRRTFLTVASVGLALFLFGALRSVITTLEDAAAVGSESRVVVRNAISIIFPVPMKYLSQLEAQPGVKSVSWQNWFGGVYIDERNFFPQFAISAERYLGMYPELSLPPDQKQAFLAERTACIIGPKLVKKFGWKLGQTVSLRGTIYPGEWNFTIRGIYSVSDPSFGEDIFYFHYEYLDEATNRQAVPGTYVLELSDPGQAAAISSRIDAAFINSEAATKTETERAFQAGFISMWGNIGFLLSVIGTAVFFAILLVAANTMMMAARERTREMAVLKSVGFRDELLFGLIMSEAALLSLLGGAGGILGAKALFELTRFDGGGMLPGFELKWATVAVGIGISLWLGLISGIVPAVQAARLPVIEALRKLV
ncbi:MAG: ABC transporter permease [Candidatus Eisenbacteria bacterium]|nr:ABC transporter permease [Candidatus Eisenbacteria bacterium]